MQTSHTFPPRTHSCLSKFSPYHLRKKFASCHLWDLEFPVKKDERDFVVSRRDRCLHVVQVLTCVILTITLMNTAAPLTACRKSEDFFECGTTDRDILVAIPGLACLLLVLGATCVIRRLGMLMEGGCYEALVACPVAIAAAMAVFFGSSEDNYFIIIMFLVAVSGSVRIKMLLLVSSMIWFFCVVRSSLLLNAELQTDENDWALWLNRSVNTLRFVVFCIVACTEAATRENIERSKFVLNRECHKKTAHASRLESIAFQLADLTIEIDKECTILTDQEKHDTFFGRRAQGLDLYALAPPDYHDQITQLLIDARHKHSGFGHVRVPILNHIMQPVMSDIVAIETDNGFLLHLRVDDPVIRLIKRPSLRYGSEASSGSLESPSSPIVDGSKSCPVQTKSSEDTVHGTGSSIYFRRDCLSMLEELGRSEHWNIEPADLRSTRPMRVLGFGGFGKVAMATLCGKAVAVKTTTPRTDPSLFGILANELRVLRRVRHPNLVSFYGAVIDEVVGEMGLVFEWIYGVELSKYVSQVSVSPKGRYAIILDTCCALWYLHNLRPPIVHGDVKASNVMVEQRHTLKAKVIDFGLSTVSSNKERSKGGTRAWSPPELIANPRGRPKTSGDVFSFGWLLHFTATGQRPHAGADTAKLEEAVEDMMASQFIVVPDIGPHATFKKESRQLIQNCLKFNPIQRPTMEKIYMEVVGWLSAVEAVDLGVECTASLLPQRRWKEIQRRRPSQDLPPTPVQVDITRSFYITYVSSVHRETATGCPIALDADSKGDNLMEYLANPDPFRLICGAVFIDLQRGLILPPQTVFLEDVEIKALEVRETVNSKFRIILVSEERASILIIPDPIQADITDSEVEVRSNAAEDDDPSAESGYEEAELSVVDWDYSPKHHGHSEEDVAGSPCSSQLGVPQRTTQEEVTGSPFSSIVAGKNDSIEEWDNHADSFQIRSASKKKKHMNQFESMFGNNQVEQPANVNVPAAFEIPRSGVIVEL